MMPTRIQRQRTKGWRMPDGTVYVGRPSRWGNPFVMRGHLTRFDVVRAFREYLMTTTSDRIGYPTNDTIRRELAGHDLACWCPLDEPCHADVLLEVANQ